MDDLIKKIISQKENSFIILDKTTTLIDALSQVNELQIKPSYILIEKNKKYFVLPMSEVQNIVRKQDLLNSPIETLIAYLKPVKLLKNNITKESVENKFQNQKTNYLLVQIANCNIGLISRESIAQKKSNPKNTVREINNISKKIKHIFNSKIFQLLTVLITIIIPTFWLFRYDIMPTLFPQKEKMSGEWNVAVASFTIENKKDLSQEEANLISNVFYNRLTSDLSDLSSQYDIVIEVSGPETINAIKGDTPEKRSKNVEQLAQEINADIVIYGLINKEDNSITITPEFFVSIKNFYEAEEVVGQHMLGSQISFSETNNSLLSQINLNRELSKRSQLLSLITKGLSLYSIHAYEDSYDFFKQANAQEFWQNQNGREVAYLFEANAAGKSYNFSEAETALLQAIEIEPEYSRAYAGLGSIYYLLAFEENSNQTSIPNQFYLEKSADFYNQALSAKIQPETADIKPKVSFGLGQINLTYWYLGENTITNAVNSFSTVISEYQNNNNYRIQELASESYARLGLIEQSYQNDIQAISNFEKAEELATNPVRKAVYWETLADLYQNKSEIEKENAARHNSIKEYKNALLLTTQQNLRIEYYQYIIYQYEVLNDIENTIITLEAAINEIDPKNSLYNDFETKLNLLYSQQ